MDSTTPDPQPQQQPQPQQMQQPPRHPQPPQHQPHQPQQQQQQLQPQQQQPHPHQHPHPHQQHQQHQPPPQQQQLQPQQQQPHPHQHPHPHQQHQPLPAGAYRPVQPHPASSYPYYAHQSQMHPYQSQPYHQHYSYYPPPAWPPNPQAANFNSGMVQPPQQSNVPQPPPPRWPQQPPPPQPHPMQYHQVHQPQQHAPHPMAMDPYMQYSQAPHPHYYPHHPQQMQPPPHQSPYAVNQTHAAGPPPMGPHPQQHPQQPTGPIYSPHPPSHPGPMPPNHAHPPPSHPQAHPQQAQPIYSPHPPPHAAPPPHSQLQPPSHPQAPPPHWVHGPHPQQGPPHPQQHMMQHGPPPPTQQMPPHVPQPAYYQPQQPPIATVVPPPQQLPPPASPHHTPSRTHTPQQHPPTSQTPTRIQQPPPQHQTPTPQPMQQQQPPLPQQQQQHPQQAPPPPSSTPASPSNVPKSDKKDITFPKNSVEATKPINTKKRKITSKDVTDIEVWRLLMCLKSGLLAESSWAIDVLSILLNDDSTLMYFGLQNTPGLLEAVLEHFKCCLNELFDGLVSDTTLKPVLSEIKSEPEKVLIKKENGVPNTINNNNNNINANNNNNTNGINNDAVVSKVVINKKKINGVVENISTNISIPNLSDQIIMLNSAKNYTSKTRDGRVVKLKNGVTPVQQEPTYEFVFKPVGYSHWQEGNGEDTSHIQVFFEPDNFIESSRRCTCLSTIMRNLSFIPGNDVEMSKHAGLLLVLGRLLLLKHDDVVHNEADSAPNEWHLLSLLREDTLVIISNISSSLDLSPYNDKINLSLLDGLLHWACCSSSYALDPFPAPSMAVSPQRLALESLAKLSIIEGNVDLILATPPWSRIEKLFEVLARLLNINEDQTVREFSLVLLSNLTSADSGIARKVALTGTAIPRLLSFLETSLADPETYSTTQDMLRRAAITLKCLSQLVDNHPLFAQHQQRLLNLVMSQKLDQEVVPIIADVIFEVSLSD